MQKRQREPQKWVSHNKVLIGSGDGVNKKPHARNPNFDSEETKMLIQLWGEPGIQRTLITVHKKHPVISRIAEKMRMHGYNRSTEEINTRIKNLKCLYNRIKKDLESGLLNEPSWKHYYAMDEILSRPVFGNGNSNKINSTPNKIIISPSGSINEGSDQSSTAMFQVKEEDFSDEDICMNFEGSELRPEDLLSVIETENENDVNIKEEPMDVATVTEIKTAANEKSDADSSTDQIIKESDSESTASANNATIVKSIVNYPNDSLSITSVQGSSNANSNVPSQISPKISSQTANKISLVPTKLLLKQQTVNGFKSTAPTSTISTISTGAQMKVVFVNALNNSGNAQQGVIKQQQQHITLNKSLAQIQAQSANQTFITNKIIGGTSQQKIQLVNQIQSSNFNALSQATKASNSNSNVISVHSNLSSSSSSNNNINNSNSSNASSKSHHHHHHQSSGKSSKSLLGGTKLPVIRNLLTNIVEIENQRLEIEKQRFGYEKKVGDELLSLLKTFVQNKPHGESTQLTETKPDK